MVVEAVDTLVFLGPTLSLADAKTIIRAKFLPPAKQGDIYAWLGSWVRTIVLIDGVFHNQSPVWQRELLAAVDTGIQVIGAGSMGALRAAELDTFGMIGIGKIYQSFRDGVLTGDDEVALRHLDGEHGYRALSVPLVNIRHNLSRARASGILTLIQVQMLVERLKALPFADRNNKVLLDIARTLFPSNISKNLSEYLTGAAENLKQLDARQALHYAAGLRPGKHRSGKLPARSYQVTMLHDRMAEVEAHDRCRVKLGTVVKSFQSHPSFQQVKCELITDFFVTQLSHLSSIAVDTPPSTSEQPGTSFLWRNALTVEEWQREALYRRRLQQFCDQMLKVKAKQVQSLRTAFQRAPKAPNITDQEALKASLLADWTQAVGATPDEQKAQRLSNQIASKLGLPNPTRTEHEAILEIMVRYYWAVTQEPFFYGFHEWRIESALIRHWQITDKIQTQCNHYLSEVKEVGHAS
jgi:hypothetical protein